MNLTFLPLSPPRGPDGPGAGGVQHSKHPSAGWQAAATAAHGGRGWEGRGRWGWRCRSPRHTARRAAEPAWARLSAELARRGRGRRGRIGRPAAAAGAGARLLPLGSKVVQHAPHFRSVVVNQHGSR